MVYCNDGMSAIAVEILKKLREIAMLRNRLAVLDSTQEFETRSLSKQFKEFMDGRDVEPYTFSKGTQCPLSTCMLDKYNHLDKQEVKPTIEQRETRLRRLCMNSGFFLYKGTLWRDIKAMFSYYGISYTANSVSSYLDDVYIKQYEGEYFPTFCTGSQKKEPEFYDGPVGVQKGKNLHYEPKPSIREGIEPNPGPWRNGQYYKPKRRNNNRNNRPRRPNYYGKPNRNRNRS